MTAGDGATIESTFGDGSPWWERRAVRSPTRFEDLPIWRQEVILWRSALSLSYEDVSLESWERSRAACRVDQGGDDRDLRDNAVAVLGDDGRFHRAIDAHAVCGSWWGEIRDQPSEDGSYVTLHEQRCHWWTDGARYRVHPPSSVASSDSPATDLRDGRSSGRFRWAVRLLDTDLPLEAVRPRERCPLDAPLQWPTWSNPRSQVGKIRHTLVTELGVMCHACGRRRGRVVDHDHFNGRVRGLLCLHCNAHVDDCPHLDNCPWADYLNEPLAAHLKLDYPRAYEDRRRDSRKIQLLGLDPYDV